MKAPKGRVIVRQRPDTLTVSDVRTGFTQIYRQNARHYSYAQAAKDLQSLSRMGIRVDYLAA